MERALTTMRNKSLWVASSLALAGISGLVWAAFDYRSLSWLVEGEFAMADQAYTMVADRQNRALAVAGVAIALIACAIAIFRRWRRTAADLPRDR